MSKINCETAGDLIPLYVDEVLSQSSVELVEEHLAECEDCTAKVETLKSSTVVKSYEDVKPLKKIQVKIKKGRIIAVSVIAAVVLISGFMLAVVADIIKFDASYDSVKDKISVVSGSNGHDAVVMYDGKVDYGVWGVENVVGHKDGKEQVEVTLYISRFFGSLKRYNENSDSKRFNGKQIIYVAHPIEEERLMYLEEGEKVSCLYTPTGEWCHISNKYLEKYDYEVIAIYYGKWKDTKYGPKPTGERHLLWKKQQ